MSLPRGSVERRAAAASLSQPADRGDVCVVRLARPPVRIAGSACAAVVAPDAAGELAHRRQPRRRARTTLSIGSDAITIDGGDALGGGGFGGAADPTPLLGPV